MGGWLFKLLGPFGEFGQFDFRNGHELQVLLEKFSTVRPGAKKKT